MITPFVAELKQGTAIQDSLPKEKPAMDNAWDKITNIDYHQMLNTLMEQAIWIVIKIVTNVDMKEK